MYMGSWFLGIFEGAFKVSDRFSLKVFGDFERE